MKRVIALGMLLLGGALLIAPAGASAEECPAGTTNNPYCTPGIELETEITTPSGNTIKLTIKCEEGHKRCKGSVLLELRTFTARAASTATASAGKTVGSTHYSIAPGHRATVSVKLSKSGRALLKKKGKLRVAVVSVVEGKQTTLGSVLIKAKKKHVTHTHGHPGFTG